MVCPFSGPDATDELNNAKLLHELAMVFELKDRSAQFHCTLVMAAPNRDSLVVEADWEGFIGMDLRGKTDLAMTRSSSSVKQVRPRQN